VKVAVIFGGMSTEHDVSIASGTSVIKNLNKDKYQIYPVYIDREGTWYIYTEKVENIRNLKVGEKLEKIVKIDNVIEYLKQMDVIFPVLHGLYGEDGTIQGMLELIKKPYVGCKVLASSLAMDKAYAKMIFAKAGITQARHVYIRKCQEMYIHVLENLEEERKNLEELCDLIEQKQSYPMFVKPSNSGSSVGIQKAKNKQELKNAIIYAGKFDTKMVIEEGIIGREVECSVLGNENVIASGVGEIIPADEFYSYEAKYEKAESKTLIPADLDKKIEDEIRTMAIKAFRAIDGSGLSRVDFFVKSDGSVVLNEINTMPGFTEISMYAKLWKEQGISYAELLEKLICLAIEK